MKRILLVLLVLGMLTGVLFACKPKTPVNPVETGTAEIPAEDNPGFPKANYNDREFHVLVNNENEHFDMKSDFIGAPDGNIVEQAIYRRTAACEEYLGIAIEYHEQNGAYNSGIIQALTNYIEAESCIYDMVAIGLNTGIRGQNISIFYNVLDMDSINVEHDWWVQDTVEQVSMNGQLYFLTGDVCTSTYGYLGCVFANLRVADDFRLGVDFYELVEDDQWTLDAFLSLFRDVSRDVDGTDGISTNDVFGWANVSTGVRVMWSSCDMNLFVRDEVTEAFSLKTALDDRMLTFVDQLKSAYELPNSFYFGDMIKAEADNAFIADRCLFYTYYVFKARSFNESNMTSSFAILPLPKYNEEQSNYISTNVSAYNALFFPSSITDPTLCGKVAEYMGWSGKRTVVPVYYDEFLKLRSTNKEENIAMLDLIRENLRITPNELYGVIDDVIGYTALTDRNVIGAESAPAPFYSNPVSQWKKISGLANKDLRAYILKYYGQE